MEDIQYPNDPVSRNTSLVYLIKEMAETVNGIGAKLIVVYLPLFGKGYIEPPPNELLDCLNSDILFVDLSQEVNEYYREDNKPVLPIPGDYAHPGILGHELIAKELESVIKRENLLR